MSKKYAIVEFSYIESTGRGFEVRKIEKKYQAFKYGIIQRLFGFTESGMGYVMSTTSMVSADKSEEFLRLQLALDDAESGVVIRIIEK